MNKTMKILAIGAMSLGLSFGTVTALSYGALASAIQVSAEAVEDKLTASMFKATTTSYMNFSDVEGPSGAVYAGQNAKTSKGGIQLRATKPSGIVATSSGGLIRSVSIEVESGTNTVDVYGSHSAYSTAADLYNTSTRGTYLGSLKSTELSLDITGDYEYVAVRSKKGAIYLTSVTFAWEQASAPEPGASIKPTSLAVSQGETAIADGSTFNYVSENLSDIDFTPTAAYQQGEGYVDGSKLSWTSSNESVATVNAGKVSVLSAGTTTITVATTDATAEEDNQSVSFTLDTTGAKGLSEANPFTPSEAVAAYSTAKSKKVFIEGYITSWSSDPCPYLTATKEGTGDKIELYSKTGFTFNEGSSSVDFVTGSKVIASGTFALYKTTYELTAPINVTISVVEPVDSISVKTAPTKTTYNVGETFDPAGLVITKTYESRSVDVAYSETTASEFSFNPSLDTPITEGLTEVTVTVGGKSASIAVTVDAETHTDAIVIQKDGAAIEGKAISHALDAGDIELTALVTPSDSVDPVTWTSSNEDLAIVIDGTVTFGEKTGNVRITASSGSASDYVDITLTAPTDATINSIDIVAGSGAKTAYYRGETKVDTTGLTVKGTRTSAAVAGWTDVVDVPAKDLTWELDREAGMVIARLSESVYALLEVHVSNDPAPTTVVASYSGSTTNMKADTNNADSVGLSAVDWNVTSTKGAGSNVEVGLNKDGVIRLYKGTGGAGTILTFALQDKAKEIKSITVNTSTASTNFQIFTVSGETKTVLEASGKTYIVGASAVSVQNTSTDAINFKSFSLDYGYVSSFVAAMDFEENYLLNPGDVSLPYDAGEGTGACREQGYYDAAASAYASLSSETKVWFATREEFANARARLSAWAAANGKTIAFNAITGAIEESQAVRPFDSQQEVASSSSTAIAAIVCGLGVVSAASLLLLRRKKQDRE